MARTRRSAALAQNYDDAPVTVGNVSPTYETPNAVPSSLGLSNEGRVLRSRSSNSRMSSRASISSAVTSRSCASGSGYSTPLTSNVATPAPTAKSSFQAVRETIEINIPDVQAPGDSSKSLNKSIYNINGVSKRKWGEIADSDEDDLSDSSPDAKLARRLQEEEDLKTDITLKRPVLTARAKKLGYPPHPIRESTRLKGKAPAIGRSNISTSEQKKCPSHRAVVVDSEDELNIFASGYDSDSDVSSNSTPATKSTRRQPSRLHSSRPTRAVPSSASQPAQVTRAAKGKAPAAPNHEEEEDYDDDDDDMEVLSSTSSVEWLAALSDQSGLDSDPDDLDSDPDDLDSDFDTTRAPLPPLRNVSQRPRPNAVHARPRPRGRRYRDGLTREERDKAKLEHSHPYMKTLWEDFEALPVLEAGMAEQPKNISRTLKPFQLQGLAWMKAMEKGKWKGGLLGDEMGLGKTIQAVSLIMSDWPAKNPSLVLAPPVALMQWMSEIDSYTDGTLKTLMYHGSNSKTKQLTAKDLKKFDVIIMSYNSLESLYRKQEKGFNRKDGLFKEESLIHMLHFHRVILDEAHYIKERTTMTSKACAALRTNYRWCLSGTPLQNRIGEFFSLVRFLRIEPFANYLCRDCPCSSLDWLMDDSHLCSHCKHGGLRHVSVFNQELLNPIQKYGKMSKGAAAFRKLRLLTSRIMLRRQKKDHMDSMELPVKEIVIDREFFDEEETDFAGSIMHNNQRRFDTYVAQGVVLNNYANIFGLLMQMRQVADHPDLILKKDSEGGQNVIFCCICDDAAEDAIRSQCKHDFCRSCASSYVNATDSPACPRCHIGLSIDLEQPETVQDEDLVKKHSIINRIKMENWTSSTKIEMLVHALQALRSDNARHKSIVFSQFTGMLQLIEWRLRRAGITTVMLDGSMTPAQRQASIDAFMNDVDVECFLVSLKAGGVALNLTEASRVFIVDPWWNPAAEWQSADRCHRIGQTRPCVITRLCIEDSIESRIVLLQEKKTKMINSTVNAEDAALDALEPEDLQFLFRGS